MSKVSVLGTPETVRPKTTRGPVAVTTRTTITNRSDRKEHGLNLFAPEPTVVRGRTGRNRTRTTEPYTRLYRVSTTSDRLSSDVIGMVSTVVVTFF